MQKGCLVFINDKQYHNYALIFQAGEKRFGTDEAEFNRVLSTRSHDQLREIFKQYEEVSEKTIFDVIEEETSGNLRDAYHAVGKDLKGVPQRPNCPVFGVSPWCVA